MTDDTEPFAAMLDLMVTAIAPPTPAKDRPMMKHRLARTIAVAAAAVLSAGGVAAAATGINPLRPIVSGAGNSSEHPTGGLLQTNFTESNEPPVPKLTTTTSTTTSTTSTSTSTTSTTAPPPTSTTVAAANDCTTTTHGAEVSAVARDKNNDSEQNHGTTVSATAHDKTDCDELDNQPALNNKTPGQQADNTDPDDDHSPAIVASGDSDPDTNSRDTGNKGYQADKGSEHKKGR